MKVTLYIEIEGTIDSRELYNDIERYRVNVTDLRVKTLVYGEVQLGVAFRIIEQSAKYGSIMARIN